MELFDFFISLVLLGFSFALLAYLLKLLLAPIRGSIQGTRGSIKLKRSLKRIADADQFLEEKKLDEALRELRRAILLDLHPDMEMIGPLREHHQNILSRFLVISEEYGSRISNIAVVEQLFLDQTELHLDLVRAKTSYNKLQDRRKQSGKDIPSWSKNDYQARISEVKKALGHNQRQLHREIERLVADIKTPVGESITYH